MSPRIPLILTAALARVAFCQTFTARITGTVADPSGAPIPDATIAARQVETNVSKSARSGPAGVYTIALLLPGNYAVTVSAAGMQTQVRRDVKLEVNQAVTLDFTLAVSQLTTVVDVTAEVPLLQSETSNVGSTLETRLIEEFPLLERDVMSLVRSLPGIVAGGQVGAARGGRNVFDSTFSVAGGRSSTNEVLLDGAANTIGDFNGVVVVPPVDSVQEFRVETSSYSAEFGRSGGGAVNIVTKAGTNRYHGVDYYYGQNTAFNANSFENNRVGNPRPRLRRHQYGGTLGGPVFIPKLYQGKDKTFFFTSFEGRRENNPAQSLSSVPTGRELAGDFSQTVVLVAGVAQPVQIFDPATSRIDSGQRIRDPFADNMIPADRLNPIAKRVLQDYPAPNRAGNPVTHRQNYYYTDAQRYSRDVFSGRIDHYFSGTHRLFGRGNWQESFEKNPGEIVQFASTTSTLDNFRNLGLDDTWQATPRLSVIFRYAYTRYRANIFPRATLGFDPTKLGLPAYFRDNANVLFYPNFSFGFTNVGGTAYNNQPRDTQGFQEQLLYIKGRHNLRGGGEFRLYRFYPFQVFNPTGSFSFSQQFTQRDHLAVTSPTLGFGLASFLLGTGSFSFEHVEALTAYHHYGAAYIQDDWKATSRLTLNLGLRWDIETGTAESHDRLSYFDPHAPAPLPGAPQGAIHFTGGPNPRTMRAANTHNFGPRIGFAYRIGKRTAVRGGYGIFYLPLGVETGIVTTPFNYTLAADNANADYTPKATLSNPFPGGLAPPESSRRLDDGAYRLGTNANIFVRDQPPGYMQEWNFGIARQKSRTVILDATYYGSRGVHLPIPSEEFNQLNPSYLANGGDYLTALVPNPYFGQFSSGLLAQRTIPRMQLLKPYPQFANPSTANAFGGSLFFSRPPVGDSIYHAVTFKLERRFSKGLSVNAHYTISKLIDVGGVGNGAAFTDASALRDLYNTRLERSVSAWDVPQRLVVTYSWDLPFGRKARRRVGPWLEKIVGGWTVFSFHAFESGRPIAVGGPDRSRLAGAGPSRANVVAGQQPGIPLDQARENARAYDPRCICTRPWFNKDAFTIAPEFTIPNGPRFVPDVRQDSVKNWDMTLSKKFRLREGMSLIFTGHFFNLLNQVYFGAPNGDVTSANFGSTTSVASPPRRVELGVKLYW